MGSITTQIDVIEEEHGGEEGLLSELDKVNKASVTARLREIKGDKDAKEEADVLNEWLKLNTKEADLKKRLKELDFELDQQAYAKYAELSQDEIKVLVVEDKWMAALNVAIHGEMDRISQALTHRVKQLAERYSTPLPKLTDEVATLAARVDGHLKKMGFTS